jgi:hypothetical protein
MKLRKDIELPNAVKSRIDIFLPNRPLLVTDTAEPIRAKDLIEIADPK